MNKKMGTANMVAYLIIITSILLFVLAAVFKIYEKPVKVKEKVTTDKMYIKYTAQSNSLDMKGFIPEKEEDVVKSSDKKYKFDFNLTLDKKSNKKVDYELSISKSKDCNINNIMVYLQEEREGTYTELFKPKEFVGISKKTKNNTPKGEMILLKESSKKSFKQKYRLKAWIKEGSEEVPDTKCILTLKLHANIK